MTEQYLKRDINNGQNFFFREFQTDDPIIPPFPSPSQVLSPETQLATLDTRNIAGVVVLPLAAAAGPNAEIAIVAANASSFPLTITGTGTDTFVVSAGISLVIAADNIVTTFRSNGFDNWIAVSQTT